MTRPIRLMIVDDHPIVRQGIASLLNDAADLDVVAQAGSVAEAVARFAEATPDVVLVDLRLADGTGVDVIERVRTTTPDARFIVLTTYDTDDDAVRAIEAGARGYLLKDTFLPEILETIRAVASGQRRIPAALAERLSDRRPDDQLTNRELDVLRAMARGGSNKDVARELGISEGTVKTHVVHILAKLGATDRTGAVATAIARGLVR